MTMSLISTFSDLELVERLVQREAEAFNEIYRRHAQAVGACAKMVLGNSSADEDVVAEVFLALWLRPECFDATRGSLLGFLRMKARCRSVDVVRSEVARRRREATDTLDSARLVEGSGEDFTKAEVGEQLHETIAALVDREREPINLAFFKGMTYKDVAEHLDLPEGTVKARIRSGLHNAREIFDAAMISKMDEGVVFSVPIR